MDEKLAVGSIPESEVSASVSGWRSVMSSVLLGSVLGLILFNIFINDTDSGVKCNLSKSVDNTKLWGAVGIPVG